MLQDVRYGLRFWAKSPGFAAMAILTLALGIGATTAIFSLVSAVLIRPLPYPKPEELVGLGQWRNQQGEGYVQTGVSAPNMQDIGNSGVFQNTGYFRWSQFNITNGDRPQSIDGIKTSEGVLPMFDVPPLMGRLPDTSDMEPGRDHVAVIGYTLWRTRFGADPNILGKTIELNREPYTIIGVMPARFRFTWDQEVDAFVPLVLTPDERSEKGRSTTRDLQAQARLKDGVSIAKAQAVMDTLSVNLARQYPEANKGWGFKIEPLHAAYHRRMQTPLLMMLGAVMAVLLIACANVSNLLLSRATARKREIAIRTALGASRGRLLRQLVTESLLLVCCAGVVGVFLAYVADRLLTFALTAYDIHLPNARIINIDWRVLLFTAVVTVATGFAFGLAPSWITSASAVNDALKEGALSTTAELGKRRLRKGLVIGETALALLLLVGSGLLVRTFIHLLNVNLGFDPSNAVTLGISLPEYKFKTPVEQAQFFRAVMQKMEALPGVTSAGAEAAGANVLFQPQGQPPAPPGQEPTAGLKIVTPDFLKAIGTHVISGRAFADSDIATSEPVAIVSQTLARRYWPKSNAIGHYLTILGGLYSGENPASSQPLRVIGIAEDVRERQLWTPQADIYVPFAQEPLPYGMVVVRTTVPPLNVVPQLQQAVGAVDKEQPINHVQTLQEMVAETYGVVRFPMTLVWILSAIAIVLSAVGVFGVMSYTVTRRTRELAVRMALGATHRDVLGMVLNEGLSVTLIGIAIGLAAALGLSRVMAQYVYGISATDPLTLIGACFLLTGIAMLASYIPARRASQVDPLVALRYE